MLRGVGDRVVENERVALERRRAPEHIRERGARNFQGDSGSVDDLPRKGDQFAVVRHLPTLPRAVLQRAGGERGEEFVDAVELRRTVFASLDAAAVRTIASAEIFAPLGAPQADDLAAQFGQHGDGDATVVQPQPRRLAPALQRDGVNRVRRRRRHGAGRRHRQPAGADDSHPGKPPVFGCGDGPVGVRLGGPDPVCGGFAHVKSRHRRRSCRGSVRGR